MAIKNFPTNTYIDRREKIWWESDKFEVIPSDLTVSFEQLEFEATSIQFIGDMVCDFQVPEFSGESDTENISHLAVDLEPLEADCTGFYSDFVGSIDVEFVEPHLEMQAGLHMDCTFQPMEYESSFTIIGEDMECTFKELTFSGSAENSYRSMTLEFEPLQAEMYMGHYIKADMEKMTCEVIGINGLVADMSASLMRFDFSGTGGPPPHIDAVAEKMTLSVEGSTSISGKLTASMANLRCLMVGNTDIRASLDLRIRSLYTTGWIGGRMADYVGEMQCSFWPMSLLVSGVVVDHGDIVAEFEEMDFVATDISAGCNGDLELHFEEPEISMATVTTACESPVVLQFGGC